MWNILFKSIVTVLVIYALVDIIKQVIHFVLFRGSGYNENVFIAIKVKNNQDNLEGVVRRIICQYLKNSNGGIIPTILIVDGGSTDETRKIALSLCDDYSFVYYTTLEEYEKLEEKFTKE